MEYKYNYTIIIPHKNLPNLLKRCVESIPKRDDLQIIIVDDNSSPSIVNFDEFPYLEDRNKNIEIVFDKSGKRQGHARNLGIDRAAGRWLLFADSDDFFFYSINRALDETKDCDADIVYFKATILDSETYQPYSEPECLPNVSINKYLRGDNDGDHYVRYRYPAPWGKIIKTDLVRSHNIRFAELERLEDSQFSYLCGHFANKIVVKDYSIYCYVKRDNTVTTQLSRESGYVITKVCSDCMIFLREQGLTDSPTYKIMTDMMFDNLINMRVSKDELYSKSIEYIESLDYDEKFIRNNLKRRQYVAIKSKIIKMINKCIGK